MDYVRGSLKATDEPLPRMPPLRFRGGQLARLFAAYSFQTGKTVSTITACVDNLTDELYRNHLSCIKHLVPEMGRNFKLLYGVRF